MLINLERQGQKKRRPLKIAKGIPSKYELGLMGCVC
jgi:hypothetical protein